MDVIATAGHVDHGKSTLVRALTGIDPDRHADEKRRGLTIDLGYAWTTVPGPAGNAPDPATGTQAATRRIGGHQTDRVLAFVDVPGHERFITTMLAGLGPSPAVLLVVAADEGWRRQSSEHLAAAQALGLSRGVLAVTRCDLADPGPAITQAHEQMATTSLASLPAVAISALAPSAERESGLPQLRTALAELVATMPQPDVGGRVRLWVDRSFTIRGAGTVITGTLGAGTLAVGDELDLNGRRVRIRALQTLGREQPAVSAVARVAVNLRDVAVADVGRGDALLTPGGWQPTATLDVRCSNADPDELGDELVAHLGTAAVAVRLRRLSGAMIRLKLHRQLPAQPGDRLVLRDPGRHTVAAGATVLDADPPTLRRRGAARSRAAELASLETADPATALAVHVGRRGAARRQDLLIRGIAVDDIGQLQTVGDWLVDPQTWRGWQTALTTAVRQRTATSPLDPRLPVDEARRLAGVPDRQLLRAAAQAAGLSIQNGKLSGPEAPAQELAGAEAGLSKLEQHLTGQPFAAPERLDLADWGLGRRELAAAERLGRIVRLADDIVLLPTGPARAMRILSQLPQPFTASQARRALGTTRRVAIPLLEHLDRRGWTIRVDTNQRRIKETG
jgi:selenocysteine-specific elongation factor